MGESPLASLDILESVATHLQDDASRRALRLVSLSSKQAIDRCCVTSLRINLHNMHELARHGKLASLPNILHLSLTFPHPLLHNPDDDNAWQQVLNELPQLNACSHLEIGSPAVTSPCYFGSSGNLLHGGPRHTQPCTDPGVPPSVWQALLHCCPPNLKQLTVPHEAWRMPAHNPSRHLPMPILKVHHARNKPEHHVRASSVEHTTDAGIEDLQLPPSCYANEAEHQGKTSCSAILSGTESTVVQLGEACSAGTSAEASKACWATNNPASKEDVSTSSSCNISNSIRKRRCSRKNCGSNGIRGSSSGIKGSSSYEYNHTSCLGVLKQLPAGVAAAAAQVAAATAAADAGSDSVFDTNRSSSSSSRATGKHEQATAAETQSVAALHGGSEARCGSGSSSGSDSGNGGIEHDDGGGGGGGGGVNTLETSGNGYVDSGGNNGNPAGTSQHNASHAQRGDEGMTAEGSRGINRNLLSNLLEAQPQICGVTLTGLTCCWSRAELSTIAGLRGLTRLSGLSVTSLDITPLTALASSLHRLEVCLLDSLHPNEQDPSSHIAHAPALTVSSLPLLTHLDLWGYSGNPTHLILQLASLPLLAHLSLFGLAAAYSAHIDDLALRALALLPALVSFGADQLSITEQDADEAPCLLQLTRLEVGQRVLSFQRLPRVFPNVRSVKLQWLWEQAMRKLAGWLSVTSLSLSHLSYCVDWRLLRTLQNLRCLSLDACSSMQLLGQLLELCAHLPCLTCLSLSYWGIELVEQRQLLRQQQWRQQAAQWDRQQQQQQQGYVSEAQEQQQEEELNGPIAAAIAHLSGLTHLERLELHHCPTALLVSGATAPPNLKELHLSGIALTGSGLVSLILGHAQCKVYSERAVDYRQGVHSKLPHCEQSRDGGIEHGLHSTPWTNEQSRDGGIEQGSHSTPSLCEQNRDGVIEPGLLSTPSLFEQDREGSKGPCPSASHTFSSTTPTNMRAGRAIPEREEVGSLSALASRLSSLRLAGPTPPDVSNAASSPGNQEGCRLDASPPGTNTLGLRSTGGPAVSTPYALKAGAESCALRGTGMAGLSLRTSNASSIAHGAAPCGADSTCSSTGAQPGLASLASLSRLVVGPMLPVYGHSDTTGAVCLETAARSAPNSGAAFSAPGSLVGRSKPATCTPQGHPGVYASIGEETIALISRACPKLDVLWRP